MVGKLFEKIVRVWLVICGVTAILGGIFGLLAAYFRSLAYTCFTETTSNPCYPITTSEWLLAVAWVSVGLTLIFVGLRVFKKESSEA